VPNLGEAGGQNHLKSVIKMLAFFIFKNAHFGLSPLWHSPKFLNTISIF
jgi:hypothetical protein